MSEENSPRGILSAEDAEAMLVKRGMATDEETDEVELSESDESEEETDEVETEEEADDSDEVLEDEATDESEEDKDDTADDVDADERRKGEMRQADYTRKTQELAEQRRQLEAQQQQFETQAQQQLEQLQKAVETFSIQTDVEPNWSELAEKLEPKAYNAKRAEWDAKQAKVRQAQTLRQEIEDRQHEARRQQEASRLLERIPEWRDPQIQKAETKEILSVAAKFGLSEDEVSSIMDHRQIEILRTLAIAERAQKAAAKKQSKPRKKVSAAASPQQVNEAEKAKRDLSARFKKSGSVDDAVAALMARGAR